MADRDRQIQLKIEDIAKEQGAELIDFRILCSSGRYILRCTVDYPQGGITLGSCAVINKKAVAFLEESNCLGGDYAVEINSPGLDRKLTTAKDFLRVKGRWVSLWLNQPVDGKEYLEGRILAVDGEKLSLNCKDTILEVDVNKIKTGKEKIEAK